MSTTLLEAQPLPVAPGRLYTPEDLLRMPDGHRYELLDGKLVERNMGARASQVALKTGRLVGNHVEPNKLGKVFAPDCGYQVFGERAHRVRYPDGSFVARGRLPGEQTPPGHIRIAPDWALEVVSPNDAAEEVEAKRIDFITAGVKLLWIIYPEKRTIHVFRPGTAATVLTEADELTGEDVLPGFKCRVAELFEE